ncbi:MAG: hypothetical protein ACRCZ2_09185 [Fusobacteriaceae bacterium]
MKQYTTLDLELIGSGEYTTKELSEILERSEKSIYAVAKNHSLKYKTQKIKQSEIDFIKKYDKRKTCRWIADWLGIDIKRVYHIRFKLGKRSKIRLWTPEEDKFIMDNIERFTNQQLAVELNRTKSAVISRNWKLGAKR